MLRFISIVLVVLASVATEGTAKPVSLDPFQPPTILLPAATPGWRHGRNNCGPMASPPVKTNLACVACCNAAAIPTGPLNPGEVTNCIGYCGSVYITPFTPPSWTYWFARNPEDNDKG